MSKPSINRRDVLLGTLGASAAFTINAQSQSQNSQQASASHSKRNVLLFIADDHGQDMPSYGNPSIQTPHLEALAADGVRFTNAFCTTPSCSASRSVIFSGLHNHLNGQYGHTHSYHHFKMFDRIRPVSALLKRNGYATGLIGKFHVEPSENFMWDTWISGKVATGGNRNVTLMAKHAEEFLEANKDDPFFLVVSYSDPHRAGKGFGNEKNESDIEPVTYSPDEIQVPDFLPDTPECRQELAEYAQAVSRMDKGIGLVMDALKAAGRDEDTLVIYISDNGIAFPGAKTCLYDPGINLPMIVRKPNQKKKGVVNEAMVSFVDITPTILDWTATDLPEYPLHGRSVLPVLEEENPDGWDEIQFSHTFHEITMYYPSRGVRTKRYKYIHNLAHQLPFPFASDLYASKTWQSILDNQSEYYGPRKITDYLYRAKEELYDLQEDPNEVKNLAESAEHQDLLKQMRQRCMAFRKRTNDPWLILDEDSRNTQIERPD